MDEKKLKIYYVANARMPTEKAHGIQLAKMCEAFAEQGADIELVVPDLPNIHTSSVREFYSLRKAIALKKLLVINISTASWWGYNLRAISFAVSSFVYMSMKYLRGMRDGLIYTLDMDQLSFFSLVFTGLPVFMEAHAAKRRTVFTRFFFRLCDGIIANSPGTAVSLKNTFESELDDDRVMVAHNGIDFSSFDNLPDKVSARRQLGLPQDKSIVLYVGRFYDWKGLGIVTKAATFVPGDVAWFLVGGNADQYKAVTGGSLPGTARAVGDRPFSEIPLWLAAADALLVLGTSQNEQSWLETSPMKLFEYMASGRPIVASKTPANQEIITNTEAFFYTPDDEASMAAAIAYALTDHATASAKAAAARQKVGQFTWEKRAKAIAEFIRKH